MPPVISCALVDDARRELEFVLENGARAVLIKPAPVKGFRGWRSPALPEFDPFWADVQTAGIPVVWTSAQTRRSAASTSKLPSHFNPGSPLLSLKKTLTTHTRPT